MTPDNDFSMKVQKSREAGASDDEIADFLSEKDPSFAQKYHESRETGTSSTEIFSFLGVPQIEPHSQEQQDKSYSHEHLSTKPMRVAGQFALGAVEGSPQVFIPEILGRAASAAHFSIPEQARGFRENAVAEIEDLLQQKEYGSWNEEKEKRLDKFYDLARMTPEEMEKQGVFFEGPKIAPSTLIEAIPGQAPEGGVEKTARLMGMLWRFPKLGFVKASEQVPAIAKEIVRTGPIASTAVGLQDIFGIPELVTLAGAGVGKMLYEKGKDVASWFTKKYFLGDAKNLSPYALPSSFKEEMNSGLKYADEALKDGLISKDYYNSVKPYIEEAEKYGISLPFSAITDSKYFKGVERLIAKRDLSQEAIQTLRQDAAKQFRESMGIALEDMKNSTIYQEVGGVAEALAEKVTRQKHQSLKNQYIHNYEIASSGLEKSKPISPESVKQIEDSLNRVYDKSSGSLIQTVPESSAAGLAQRTRERLTESATQKGRPELEHVKFSTGEELKQLEQQQAGQHLQERKGYWAKERSKALAKAAEERAAQTIEESQHDLEALFGDEAKNMRIDENGHIRFVKNINGSNLTKSIRSLNDIMDFEHPGVVNLFSDTKQTFQNVLEKEYGKTHAKELAAQKKGNELFSKTQNLFGESSKWKKWGLKQNVLPEDLLNTLSTVDRMKAFEKDFPEAEELMEYLKRLKVEEMLNPLFMQRKYDPGLFADGLNKLEQNPLFRYLVPEKTMNNLKGLQKLDSHLERTSSKFYKENPTNEEVSFVTSFKNFVDPRYWTIKLANRISKDRLADVYSKVLLDPNITSRMKQIGEEAASAVGNPQKMAKAEAKMEMFFEELVAIGESSAISAL